MSNELDWDEEPAAQITTPPVPEPVQWTPQVGLIVPDCPLCSTPMSPDNASQLQDKSWKHVDCPARGAKTPGVPAPRQRRTPAVGKLTAQEAPASTRPTVVENVTVPVLAPTITEIRLVIDPASLELLKRLIK